MRTAALIFVAAVGLAAFDHGGAAQAGTTCIDGPSKSILAEPDIAVDPTNPKRVLVVSNDIVRPGIRILRSYHSSDGGASFRWGPGMLGSYLGASAEGSDPVAVFDGAGRGFFGQLVWAYPQATGFDSIIGVQRTLDGGAAFQAPVDIARMVNSVTPVGFGEPRTGSVWYDKEWLAVDRSGGPYNGTLYAAWVRIETGLEGDRNRIMLSRSSDGGVSWSPPQFLSSSQRYALGPQLAVTGDGSVHVAWASFANKVTERRGRILVAGSSDGGQTFGSPRRIARYRNNLSAYNLVAFASSASNKLLACWGKGRGTTASVVVCSRSSNGSSWRRATAVDAGVGRSQDLVAVAGQGSRRFWLSMYIRGRRGTTVRLYRSKNGGRSFVQNRILASRNYKPDSFLGDYTGLEVTGGRLFAAYVLPKGSRRSRNAIYVTSLAAR